MPRSSAWIHPQKQCSHQYLCTDVCLPAWLQAALKHPYSRYGYVAAVLVGALGWALASRQQQKEQRHDERRAQGGVNDSDTSVPKQV